MDKERIYPILDFILNHADREELEAIRQALKRREGQVSFGGLDVQTIAKETGRSIEEQIGGGIDSMRQMIRKFAVDIIKKEAPDIADRDLEALISAWIPTPGQQQGSPRSGEGKIPKDLLVTMIKQYIAYKTETMDPRELRELSREMMDWPERYWESFPQSIQRIITKYLRGEIEADMCWELIERSL